MYETRRLTVQGKHTCAVSCNFATYGGQLENMTSLVLLTKYLTLDQKDNKQWRNRFEIYILATSK